MAFCRLPRDLKAYPLSPHLRDALANERVLAIMLQLHWHVELGTFDIFKYLLQLLANVANAAAFAAGTAVLRIPELVQNADDLNGIVVRNGKNNELCVSNNFKYYHTHRHR